MATQIAALPARTNLSTTFAETYGIERAKVFDLLKETALKSKDPVSDAEVAAFMIVCNQYKLNPFVKEIFGFISKGKMQYVISIDGWATIVNRQPELNGVEFEEHFDKDNIRAITCRIHRKDRALPTVVTEYFSECKGGTDTWTKWPIRMLRHKSLIQCARIAFGLAGLIDDDEAERMPGYAQGPILEGAREDDGEIDGLMRRLGWNEARMHLARKSYAGRRGDLRDHLLGELGKLSPQVKTATQAIPPDRQPDPQEAEPSEAEREPDPQDQASEREPEPVAASKTAPRPARTANW